MRAFAKNRSRARGRPRNTAGTIKNAEAQSAIVDLLRKIGPMREFLAKCLQERWEKRGSRPGRDPSGRRYRKTRQVHLRASDEAG